MITWMKKANNFQITIVQPQSVAQFQPGVAYKSTAYKISEWSNSTKGKENIP